MKKKVHKKGFTLVEMIIYVALISTFVSGAVMYALSVQDVRNKNYVVQEVQSNGRVALEILSAKIREATAVNIGSSTFDSDPGTLSLAMADAGVNPTVFDLTVNDGILQITEGVSSAINLTTDEVQVTNLIFSDITQTGEREHIKIQMTIDFNNPGGDVEFSYTETFQTAISLRQ